MSKIFQFKKFSVDQSNCGMKVNTDAALLGAIAAAGKSRHILEIGTGTGVIALMLAQRYPDAFIDAVEIDDQAAVTAGLNFRNSPFSDRLSLISRSMEDYFSSAPDLKYDLIISNPPYFINSLKSDDPSKVLARHTNADFFKNLLAGSVKCLHKSGLLYLILPLDTAELITAMLPQSGGLAVAEKIMIHSFPDSKPYRCILVLGLEMQTNIDVKKFVIYESQNVYTNEYRELLMDYLTIF